MYMYMYSALHCSVNNFCRLHKNIEFIKRGSVTE